jgi:catechol 2,3-dioxygenase-like lactoylglutathione lyase family enzyme
VSSTTVTGKIQAIAPASNIPFAITKIGHVVLNCRDLERSVKFYTQILGLKISDIYEPEIVPGGMVFMRFNADHHGVGLVGAMPDVAQNIELHHLAFEVESLDDLLRLRGHLEKDNVTIDFHGRRRAGSQIAVEFTDPDGHWLELFWGLDRVGSDEVVRPRSEWRPAQSLEEVIDNPVRGQNPVVRDKSLLRR